VPWAARFVDPIIPGGLTLLTLRDAATFIPVAIINNGDRWWFGFRIQPIEVCRAPARAI
jgi:hypothetical protein